MIDIKDISDVTLLTTKPNEGCKRKFTLMKEDYITLKFSLENPIFFKLGDYIDCDFGRFEVCDLQKPAYNTSTGGYDYELRFDAHYWKWKNKIFRFTPETAGQEASWNLTAPLDVQAGIVLRNLKALGYTYNGQDFDFSIDGTVENKSQLMTYDNINILDACFEMAKKWECECWVTENIIRFGRCEFGDPVDFETGVNVEEMTRSDSQTNYATRIYAFGSTRNIPSNYRPVDESVVVNGVVQKRLMLPVDTPYIDAYPNMRTEEAVEQVVVFDDVYPRRTGTMSDITTHEYTDKIEEEGKEPVYKKWNAYRFKDTGIMFSKDYVLEGQELKIIFRSGSLNGMEFAVTFNPCDKEGGETPIPEKNEDGSWNPPAQVWEIVRNEDYGRELPGDVMVPKNGDTYVLSGFDTQFVSDTMIPEAEEELKEKAERRMSKSKTDPSTYNCKMMPSEVYSEYGFHKLFEPGDRVNLISKAFFENGRQSRIIGFEYNLDIPYDHPVYTVGETASYSRIGELEDKLDSLTLAGQTYTGGNGGGVYVIGTNDATRPTNRNVFSALKSLALFIRKDIADFVQGIITFLNGIRIGKFVTGMIGGSGAAITVDKYGKTTYEGDRMILREELVVPKITFNCIDVISGDKANTFSFGTIKTVDKARRIATLDLLEDQTGTPHVNDICRGVFHNIEGNNIPEDAYDENGFLGYAGFSTSYFTPVEILENKPGAFSFRYEIKEGTVVHPMPGMNFFAYGNFTDKQRQAITYENRYYTRRLTNVNTWVIDPDRHIAMQDGLLEGLTVGGQEMHGYGTFQTNGYFTGVQIKFTPEQKAELQGESAYSVNLSDYEGVVVADDEGNIIGGISELQNVTADGKNVIAGGKNVILRNYKLKTQIQAFKGGTELFHSITYKENAYTAELHAVGCTAFIANGVVVVSGVTDTEDCYVDISVNCDGNAVFRKTYRVTAVRNGADGGKGDKGDAGEGGYDGDDATSFWLDSTVTQLGVNSIGSVEPSSFAVYSRAQDGEGSPYLKNWYLQVWVSRDNVTWLRYGDYIYGSSVTVRPVTTYKYYSVRAYSSSALNDACRINAVSIVLVKDGDNIASSSSPRNRGEFSSGVRYYWNSKFRDIVYDESGNVWMVDVFSETGYVTGTPSTDNSEWTLGSKDTFKAFDTALMDGANIAGFMYKDQVMQSQEQDTSGNPNMILDGKRGMQKIGDFCFYGAPTAAQGIFYSMGDKTESRFGEVCIQPRAVHTVPRNALRSTNDAQLNVLMHLGRARDNELDRVLYAGGISEFNGRVVVSSVNAEHTGAQPDKPALFVEGGIGMEGVFHCEPVEITNDGPVPSVNGKAPYSSLFKVSGSVTINLSDSAGDLPAGSEITFITMGANVWDLKYDKGIYTRGQGKRTMITVSTACEIWRVWFPVKGGPAYAGCLN